MGAVTAATLASVKGAAAIASAGASIGSAGASFAQAAKQKRMMREAEEDAAKFLKDAQNKYKINFAEQLQVPLEGYQMAAELSNQSASQALEAMKESGQRSILGGVAGLQQQAQAGADALRLSLQQDLYQREKLIADEEAQIRDRLAGLDLSQATGAQNRAADAEIRRAQSIESGFGGLQGAMSTIYEAADLYKQDNIGGAIDKVYGGPVNKTLESQARRVLESMSEDEINDLINNGKKSPLVYQLPGMAPSLGKNKMPGFTPPPAFNPFKK